MEDSPQLGFEMDKAAKPIHEAASAYARLIVKSAADPYLLEAAVRVGVSAFVWRLHDELAADFEHERLLKAASSELLLQAAALSKAIEGGVDHERYRKAMDELWEAREAAARGKQEAHGETNA
ncbi:hypothetical protein [Glycocaulis sp.]|uniref:hypothetical protein n=1 Tax=Glycocaulis sp. TaxID=1969725 RepID=UPI003F71E6F6